MRATCRFDHSGSMAEPQRGRFPDTSWAGVVSVGTEYQVLGVGMWETVLQVLFRSDHGLPTWAPAALFDIAEQDFPAHWKFSLRDGIDRAERELWTRWIFMCGYPELVDNPAHSDLLQERDRAALQIFAAEYDRVVAGGES